MEGFLQLLRMPQTYFGLSVSVFFLCLAFGAVAGLRPYRRKRFFTFSKFLCIGILLAAWALFYAVYFFDNNSDAVWYGDVGKSLILSFQHALRLFFMDGGLGDVMGMILGFEAPIKSCFAVSSVVLYLLAPLTTVGFVLSFIKKLSARVRYALSAPWCSRHIFSELNEKSLALAESLVKPFEGGGLRSVGKRFFRPLITFTNVKGEEAISDLAERAREIGAILYPVDPEAAWLWAFPWQKRSFYLISDSEPDKLRHAAHVMKRYDRENTVLYIFSRSTESQCVLSSYQEKEKAQMRMAVVLVNDVRALIYHDLEENGIKLFEGALPAENGRREIHAVVAGFGQYGTEMVKALLWYCQLPGYSVHIKVLDEREDAASRFEALCPDLQIGTTWSEEGDMRYSIHFSKVSAGTKDFLNEIDAKTTFVFVCLGNDEQNITAALDIRRALNRLDRNDALVETVVYDTDVKNRLSAALEKDRSDIRMIGDLAGFYSEGTVINSGLLREGFAVHLRWESCVGTLAQNNFYMSDYNVHSSLAKALHAGLRAHIISYDAAKGAEVFPFCYAAPEGDAERYLQILRHTAGTASAARFAAELGQVSALLYVKLAELRYRELDAAKKEACLAAVDRMAKETAEKKKKDRYLRAEECAALLARMDSLEQDELDRLAPLYRAVVATCCAKGEDDREVRLRMEYAALDSKGQAAVDAFMQGKDRAYSPREALTLADYAARIEHVRWNAYMRTEGYCPAARTDKSRKEHCDLVNTDRLTFADRIKDI